VVDARTHPDLVEPRLPTAWRWPLALLSPAGHRGRLTVLIFHRVRPEPDPLFPRELDAVAFGERLAWLRAWFNVLPLDDAVDTLARGSLPARAAAVTFDDGYADNHDVALPILREMGVPATFFIATGFLDGGRMWNDTVIEAIRRTSKPLLDLSAIGAGVHGVGSPAERRAAVLAVITALKHRAPAEREDAVARVTEAAGADLPVGLMMSTDKVRRLAAAGMGIGAHTITHPILAAADDAMARREIGVGREILEGLVRRPVRLFAYPNGKPNNDYRARHVAMVKHAGFVAAFSTAPGAASTTDSPFELPRFTPWDASARRWGARLVRNCVTSIERASA
jgi:peptidoglycan/xylan/chitin deacetylase (PgdA/CDA1 family)